MRPLDGHQLGDVGDGTADDLVADARSLGFSHVKRRTVTEWTHYGLLAAPRFRKSSQAGSDRRLYSGDQRRLFCVLQCIAEKAGAGRTPKRKNLALAIIILWACGMPGIPTEQVRRVWRTVGKSLIKLPVWQARGLAQSLVDGVAHSSVSAKTRRGAVVVLTNCLRNGFSDAETMCSVLTSVASPWPAPPGQQVERALGFTPTGMPLGVTEIVTDIQATGRVLDLLRTDQVEEADLETARWNYQALVQPVIPGGRPLTIGQTLSTSAGPWTLVVDPTAPPLIVFELVKVLGLGSRSGSLFIDPSTFRRHPT